MKPKKKVTVWINVYYTSQGFILGNDYYVTAKGAIVQRDKVLGKFPVKTIKFVGEV